MDPSEEDLIHMDPLEEDLIHKDLALPCSAKKPHK
jgi:hypothetical protein